MKKIFLFLLIIGLFSCKSDQEKFIIQAETYIKDTIITRINDPESYQVVETKIIDTIPLSKLYREDTIDVSETYHLYKDLLKKYSKITKDFKNSYYNAYYNDDYYAMSLSRTYYKESVEDQAIIKLGLDTLGKKLVESRKFYKSYKIDTTKLGIVKIRQAYRYKNTYGGMMLDTAYIEYSNDNHHLFIENRKYHIGFNHNYGIVPLKSFRIN
jgi:hypothetical protein